MSTTNETDSDYTSTFTRTKIDIKELDKVLKNGANHGVCGGHNLGNTCFMNSSIACLSNCTELTTYFLTGKYKENINRNNREGLQGRLAEAWHDLLEEYWNSGARTGDPREVKSTVAMKVRKFGGYAQQDSNEFMTEFLSILNEDLNKTDKKEYKELKEKGDDESELDCAKRFWNLHVSLNDSIVTDLFSGLLKSEVICSNCHYKNITFDPFNTLTLAIPSFYELYGNLTTLELFYIPKYSIKKSCRLELKVKPNSPLKILAEESKNLKDFKYNLEKMIFIQVLDQKLKRFVDENEVKKKDEYIFAFDDETKEGEKSKAIPLYMYKYDKLSAFPRLLFLDENSNFGQLKKKIYYFARNYFNSPFKNITTENGEKKEIYEIDEELKEYKKMIENYDEEKLWNLFDKEYNLIFNNQDEAEKEEKEKFLNNFPYKITIKKKFEDKEDICIFDGKDNLDNLKEFEITKDGDSISNLLEKIENNEYYLNLVINTNSDYTYNNINLNTCQKIEQERKKELSLDLLLEYFCTKETLEKGNEWLCSKCNKRVDITKKFSIFYVPRLLIICLSRFSKGRGYGYGKNDEFIDFPLENLDMGKYLCGPDKEHSKYDLFAVSQHFGGTGGGHYTAVCKNFDGRWYSYNDSSCSSSSSGNVVTSAAYVLFYRRRNW